MPSSMIPIEEWIKLYETQGGRCAICKIKVYDRFFHPSHFLDPTTIKSVAIIEHCHICLIVRGITCNKCNTYIAMFEGKIEFSTNKKYEEWSMTFATNLENHLICNCSECY